MIVHALLFRAIWGSPARTALWRDVQEAGRTPEIVCGAVYGPLRTAPTPKPDQEDSKATSELQLMKAWAPAESVESPIHTVDCRRTIRRGHGRAIPGTCPTRCPWTWTTTRTGDEDIRLWIQIDQRSSNDPETRNRPDEEKTRTLATRDDPSGAFMRRARPQPGPAEEDLRVLPEDDGCAGKHGHGGVPDKDPTKLRPPMRA